MTIEEFQVAYMRSSILYPLLGVPLVGAIAQSILAQLTLSRTVRLQRALSALEAQRRMLEAPKC